MSNKKEELVEQLSQLTVLEMAELKTALEEKWGVKAAAAAAVMAVAPAAAAPAAAESTDFQITLEKVTDDKKISAIKVVREITGLGLKEAKELVESTPKVIKETAPKAEAEEIKKKVEAAGCKVTLKGL
ncbi:MULTISPECIES: 50S ribosomal protein L7/L12 [Parachlamydia]|uniref:Large ribosomal subunit protein bL12 n=1 Tax=Parachlamydia acanthamoebae (strain UV7) TaxID=765952 RepID=F8L113_PARAV|nr:50S ribosomal protein L7/L12 [Parachlamydia acanthamoebae]EFB42595.1 50S ribosomal protein L7/L12 [Parachlamydia acanthamoebae str. Hall's coccus]CCB86932.1 50S ribosomal protein L7/L12 [Parachlamydia acanthamoebae UV-7]